MAKREWIGEYWFIYEEYKSYKDEWVESSINLGRCLSNDEACVKAVQAISRELSNAIIRDAYILDGWGQLIYM